MADWEGFWSYVHNDDEAEGGRISRLAKDVVAQFELLTGEPLALFVDRDSIGWGEVWRNKIDSGLASVAFFIPVLTPRYFMSPECRRELQAFARKTTQLGIKELVMPLHYVDVPALSDDAAEDDLIRLLRTFQWEDWRGLRLVDVSAAEYRKGVARLAEHLVNANRHVERTDVPVVDGDHGLPANPTDDAPGFIDTMANAEEMLPRLVGTMEAINEDIVLVGELMRDAAADVERGDNTQKAFAMRILSARRLARRLADPADRISALGNEFASQLHHVDDGFRLIIANAKAEIERDSEAKESICTFFEAVRELTGSAREGLTAVQEMIDTIGSLEKMSRDLRPALRRLRAGLTTMVEGREVTDEWVELITSSGVECEGFGA